MSEHGFFGEHDPEWAIAQMAAHAAEAERDRRSVPWLLLSGATITTGLVIGAFVMGLTYEPEDAEERVVSVPRVAVPVTTLAPPAPVAPQPTLAPKPRPAAPTPAPTPAYEAPEPEPVVEQVSEPSNQVGPNRKITKPIDPDDR